MWHYWLINSNGAHLVKQMIMTLSQQETGDQWNRLWLKWIMMLAGGPEWAKVHNIPNLIFSCFFKRYLRRWYTGPSFSLSSYLSIPECFFLIILLGCVAQFWSSLAGIWGFCSSITSHRVLCGLRPYWQLCIKLLMCLGELHYLPHQVARARMKRFAWLSMRSLENVFCRLDLTVSRVVF